MQARAKRRIFRAWTFHWAYNLASNQLRVNAMSILISHAFPQATGSAQSTGVGFLSALVTAFFEWQERKQQQRLLQRLDDRMLKDIGLSRSDVDKGPFQTSWR